MRMTATVETPETPQPPNNYIIDKLKECETLDQVQELYEHARLHGYSEGGQTMNAILEKLREKLGDKK